MRWVIYISYSPTHSSSKITSKFPQYHSHSSGHVLTAVISNSFDNSTCAGITHTESFTCNPINIGLASCSSVKGHISNDDVFFCLKRHFVWNSSNKSSTGQSLAKIIVTVSNRFQMQTSCSKASKALSSRASKIYF
jgi:hypothetical protein